MEKKRQISHLPMIVYLKNLKESAENILELIGILEMIRHKINIQKSISFLFT